MQLWRQQQWRKRWRQKDVGQWRDQAVAGRQQEVQAFKPMFLWSRWGVQTLETRAQY